jgi:hypothetical protein
MSRGTSLLVLAALAVGCGSTDDEAPPSPASPSAPVTPSLQLTSSAALLTGHTGLAGFTLSGDGSTLYVSTERYYGGPTHFVLHALDLRAPDARPVRVQEGDDGPYLSWRGASDDGAFVLTSGSDGLHRVSRDGSADVLVPESERSWFRPAISADGGTIAFVRDDELRVFDVASSRLERVALPPEQSVAPIAVLDARTILVGPFDGSWLRRVSLDGASEDVCTGCRNDHVARTARLEASDDGRWRLVGAGGERAIGSGAPVALAISGRTVARVEIRAAGPHRRHRGAPRRAPRGERRDHEERVRGRAARSHAGVERLAARPRSRNVPAEPAEAGMDERAWPGDSPQKVPPSPNTARSPSSAMVGATVGPRASSGPLARAESSSSSYPTMAPTSGRRMLDVKAQVTARGMLASATP